MSLSETQSRAVAHGTGPCICLAGPGSGKTTVITERIKYLVQERKVSPSEILVITFTKAAAVEMKERFRSLMGGRCFPVVFGTFHAVFFCILRAAYHYSADNILKEDEKYAYLREIIAGQEFEEEDEKEFISGILSEISLVKNECIPLEHYYSGICPDEVFRNVYREYQNRLLKNRKLDFDDMLVYTWELLRERKDILESWQKRFSYILIDEFQDINTIQYEIVKMLAMPDKNLFAVGDDDQSIYRFRGAKPEIMLNFKKDFPDAVIIRLAENYRSTEYIIRGAQRVISHNTQRFQKHICGVRGNGEKIVISVFQNQLLEARAVAGKIREWMDSGRKLQDIAVLFRTNTGARLYLEVFMEYNIPFRMRDVIPNMYEHWIARDVTAYLRIAMGSRERCDFLRIINRPKRYIGRESLDMPEIRLEDLKKRYAGKDWMEERIEKMEYDFSCLARMKPYAAVNYIRNGIGYQKFLGEYASERKMKAEELYEFLDELQDAARGFSTCQEWFDHMEEYRHALGKRTDMQEEDAVVLSTLHSAKGLEFPVVFLVDAVEGNMPHKKAFTEADIQEERRLFYVGMTRAKDRLYLYYAKERYGHAFTCSRFLDELRGNGINIPDKNCQNRRRNGESHGR